MDLIQLQYKLIHIDKMPLEHSITPLMLYNVIFFNVLIFIAAHTGKFTVKKYCKTMFPVIWDGILVPVYFTTCKYVCTVYIIIYSQSSWSKLSFFFGHTLF